MFEKQSYSYHDVSTTYALKAGFVVMPVPASQSNLVFILLNNSKRKECQQYRNDHHCYKRT